MTKIIPVAYRMIEPDWIPWDAPTDPPNKVETGLITADNAEDNYSCICLTWPSYYRVFYGIKLSNGAVYHAGIDKIYRTPGR